MGSNVIVGTHNRDKNLNEPINSAQFDLYKEDNKTGPTASIKGNTVPADVEKYGTLAEGLYPARTQNRNKYPNEKALIINEGNDLPTVNGNPNNSKNYNPDGSLKPKKEHVMDKIYIHAGNNYREFLYDSQKNLYSAGCQTGGCFPGSHNIFNDFMNNVGTNFNGSYYLRGKK